MTKQKIVGFRQDAQGDWTAELACGHTQHLRHNPPMMNRSWVLTAEGRKKFLGSELLCQKCENPAAAAFETQLQIGTAVKAACLQEVIVAWQEAKTSGLCHEGAWDLAIDRLRNLDIREALKTLPNGGVDGQ